MNNQCIKYKSILTGIIIVLGVHFSAHATQITTGTLGTSTTASSPLVSNISATPNGSIRFDVGGANFTSSAGQLNISINVDALVPVVTVGTAPNQMFRDETVGAAYFGYYLSTGVKSSSQASSNMNVKAKRGAGETTGRTYYLLGNGLTTPASESDLTVAPSAFTTFASVTPNVVRCGSNYAVNGLTGATIGCANGSTVPNMDVTLFIKIFDIDSVNASISAQLEFIAVNE